MTIFSFGFRKARGSEQKIRDKIGNGTNKKWEGIISIKSNIALL